MTKSIKSKGKAPARTLSEKAALNPTQLGAVTGGATTSGKVTTSDISITKTTDKATP